MRLLECLLVDNNCYKKYHNDHITPTRIVVHSTDKAGAVLRRYVQPAEGQTIGLKDGDRAVSADEMIAILGKNLYGNSWNRPSADVAVHAAIGKVADGSYAVCKTLDYTQPCCGVAFGPNGSFDGRKIVNGVKVVGGELGIQFEMIEDTSGDKAHCKAMCDLAVEFCAYLIRMFPSIKVDHIVSHKEAHDMGYGSNHGDPEVYWQRCGTSYTMNKFRYDVQQALEADDKKQEENQMTEEQLEQFINGIIDERFPGLWDQAYQRKMESYNDNESSRWSADARKWAVENDIVRGVGNDEDGKPNYAWEAPLTREQYVTTEYRQHLKQQDELQGEEPVEEVQTDD